MPKAIRVRSESPRITRSLGAAFARSVARAKIRQARIIALEGDLGAGKTTFALGFLGYFGIRPKAASPTFVIMKRYSPKIKNKSVESIYHLDAYRLTSKKDLEALGFRGVVSDPKNIILIEWPERIKGAFTVQRRVIRFKYGPREYERILEFR